MATTNRQIERVFSVHARRREEAADGSAKWVAWSGDERFEGEDEEALRVRVRQHFVTKVATEGGTAPEALTAKLRRTWRVTVTNASVANADDEDLPSFDLFG